jgi:hypothetical protein
MPTQYDATEFVDTDFHPPKSPYASGAAGPGGSRAPTREEVDSKVTEAQQKLAELKRAQEELERERAALEEVRRRQTEFQTGRREIIESLTRSLGLLEETEFTARCDAEQMARAISGMRDALGKVQSLNEEAWSQENFNVELTRALTAVENARMEWNSARLKFPVLAGPPGNSATAPTRGPAPTTPQWATLSFLSLCKIGLAFTWPLVLVATLGLGVLVTLLVRSW